MRELIVTEFVSLDGVMEAPGGEPGYAHTGWVWARFTPELGQYKLAEHLGAEVLLLGRRTYEGFHGHWPERQDAMADKINTMRKLVASRTLSHSDWHDTTIIDGDLAGAIAAVKQEEGGPILVAGSRSVAQQLLAAGLVDQLHLQVFPLALGSGERLWPDAAQPLEFALTSARALEGGVVLAEYRPSR